MTVDAEAQETIRATIRETRALVAEYGGPGMRLPEQVARCVAERDQLRARVAELERDNKLLGCSLSEAVTRFVEAEQETDTVRTRLVEVQAASQRFADPISKAVLAQIERETAEHIARLAEIRADAQPTNFQGAACKTELLQFAADVRNCAWRRADGS